jgi:hypothetical protein
MTIYYYVCNQILTTHRTSAQLVYLSFTYKLAQLLLLYCRTQIKIYECGLVV